MERPTKSFVVEHKRQSRGSGEVASIWSDSAGRKLRSLLQTGAEESVRIRPHELRTFATPKDNEEARPVSTGRILEDQSPAADPETFSTPRRRGRPCKAPAAPKAFDAFVANDLAAADDQPAISEMLPNTKSSSAPSLVPRFSYLERRASARKALPLGKRWKWDLDF